MKHFFSISAWLATFAGLIFSIISTLPEVWNSTTISAWLWTSSGWVVAFIFCVTTSVERSKSDKKVSDELEKHRILTKAHSKVLTAAKRYKLEKQEAVAEAKAAYRANSYLLDRLEQSEPRHPIKRKGMEIGND